MQQTVPDRSVGFAPIARPDARVLILGSLPGQRSLAEQQYYAYPQNAFWKIMAELVAATGDYPERCQALLDAGIALWDVLASSVRSGSLDSAIDLASAEPNDLESFLATHSSIELILFNGRKAAAIFARRIQASVLRDDIQYHTLPSSSPAYASMRYEQKLAQWKTAMDGFIRRSD